MLVRKLLVLGIFACATILRGATANTAFSEIRRLAGNWQASVGAKGTVIRVNFRPIADSSAVVETFTVPSGRETLTIFYPDGDRLLATHYCAQGNQPRLMFDPAANSATGQELTFRFVDATNLTSEQDDHLVRLVLRIKDQDHFDKTEIYKEKGVEESTTYHFERLSF